MKPFTTSSPSRALRGALPRPGRVADLLREAGFAADIDTHRGLDHGAWVPLSLMYPQADIPVTQVSVQSHFGPAHHLRLGRALAQLRRDGVLIVGRGSFTHDLSEFRGCGLDDPAPAWVTAFADWFDAALTEGRTEDLLAYRERAPFAAKNHPTEEHLLPLFVALGAAGEDARPERLHASTTHGVPRMDVHGFRGYPRSGNLEAPLSRGLRTKRRRCRCERHPRLRVSCAAR